MTRRISGHGYAGVRVPTDAAINVSDRAERAAAAAGSAALLEAIQRYLVKHHGGLPGASA